MELNCMTNGNGCKVFLCQDGRMRNWESQKEIAMDALLLLSNLGTEKWSSWLPFDDIAEVCIWRLI